MEPQNLFWIWIIVAALLCIGEMLSLSFFMLPFAVGAICAAIANALGANTVVQWAIFIAVSIIALIALRPLSKRITRRSSNVKSGVDRLVDRVGEVIEGTAPIGLVRVRVEREEWNATVEDGTELGVGDYIRVIGIDGTRLIVLPLFGDGIDEDTEDATGEDNAPEGATGESAATKEADE